MNENSKRVVNAHARGRSFYSPFLTYASRDVHQTVLHMNVLDVHGIA